MKPTATLTITRTASGSTLYQLHAAGVLVWSTRAYSTDAGCDAARGRLRTWLRAHPYTVVLAKEGNEQQRRRA